MAKKHTFQDSVAEVKRVREHNYKAKNTQFLTDGEYEALRVDIGTILGDIKSKASARLDNGVLNIDINLDTKSATDKLTAYVDQKIKRYY